MQKKNSIEREKYTSQAGKFLLHPRSRKSIKILILKKMFQVQLVNEFLYINVEARMKK